MAEAKTPRDVMLDAVHNILRSIEKGRSSKAVKDLTDLLYYANAKGLDETYLNILDRVMREVERKPERFRARFAESLNTAFEEMKYGNEVVFLGRTLVEAERLKMERLGRYFTPPEDLRREAERILSESWVGR